METIKSLFSSPDGDLSPKRVFGTLVLVAGLVWLLVGSATKNVEMVNVGRYMLPIGGAMLGITALEHIGKG